MLGYRKAGRPISVSTVPLGPGIDIQRSCRFIQAACCELCALSQRAAYHVGWEMFGHGLTSRPPETSSVPFFTELVLLFRYPATSWGALLHGVHPLRYCTTRSACRVASWVLPPDGHVAGLTTEGGEDVGLVHVRPSCSLR